MPRLDSPAALEALRKRLTAARTFWPIRLILSSGTCGQASGSLAVLAALRQRLDKPDLRDSVHVRVTGCQGFCEQEPLLILDPLDVIYCRVKPQDIEEIVSQSVIEGRIVERLLYADPVTGARVRREADLPFFAKQDRVLISQNRWVDPCNLGDYITAGGYSALATVLSAFAPQRVIDEIKASGLRGRGGGGYPTGRKWEQCRRAPGDQRYVICNADEGDPGAYMDRGLLEGNPHLILEGMLIGAYAVGSAQGFVYVRNEYPLAVQNVRVAIEQAREMGLLGQNILGSGFSFDVKVARGGGAFVCGESTALMASLEGKVGEPRAKDVHTVERGYLNQPSLLNNVETWANIPEIIRRGPAWFAARGTETSKGSKIFALTGQVKHTGLVEVRMGTTLREIIFEIGGGPRNGEGIKAVQTGGPSGGCLPVSLFDLPVDFEALAEAGSMMGSGGMVVIDESVCMVDFAKYFLHFLQDESCGKCVPCRVGIGRMEEILEDFCQGRGTMAQFAVLEELAWTVQNASLCALGKTAPNPVLSTLRHFRDEYLAHVEDRRCPAGACKALIRYEIDDGLCVRCGECVAACPHGAIRDDEGYVIEDAVCQKCGICEDTCPSEAIRRVRGLLHA